MRHLRPRTIDDAVGALGDGATVLAGGTVLVPAIASGTLPAGAPPSALVDLAGLGELRALEHDGAWLRVGAMVTMDRLLSLPRLGAAQALFQAAAAVGNPNVRRAATVGGNVALRQATCDLHPALLALDGVITVRDAGGGERELPAAALSDAGVPTRALIREVRVPLSAGGRSSFVKVAWRATSALTVVALAVWARIEGGVVRASRLAASGLRPRATRLLACEAALADRPLDRATVERAAAVAAAELSFDLGGAAVGAGAFPGEKYRRRLLAEAVRRTLGEVGRA